jgi:hypothetical protein
MREDIAHLGVDELAQLVSQWAAVSGSTISRFEHQEAPPNRPQARTVLVLAALACGVDPEELELSIDDLPPAWDREAVMASLAPASPCNPRSSRQPPIFTAPSSRAA